MKLKPTGYNRNSGWLGGNKFVTEFYTGPINYFGLDRKWHPLTEVASYFGNVNGMTLMPGWENKIHPDYLLWYLQRNAQFPNGKGIRLTIPSRQNIFDGLKLYVPMNCSTLTANPVGGDPGSPACDGFAQCFNATYATAQSGGGTLQHETNNNTSPENGTHNSNLGNYYVTRAFFLFDTSSLTSSATISAATMSIYVDSVADTDSDSMRCVTTTPASNTTLANADFSQTGTTAQASDIAIGSLSLTAYNDMALNSTGRGNISKTSITKFGWRNTKDISAAQPTGSNSPVIAFAECTSPTSKPKLVVTYTLPATSNPAFLLNFM